MRIVPGAFRRRRVTKGAGDMKQKKTLGEKLREIRESLDLTQNQVAKVLNIDRSTYTYYELDGSEPSLETLGKLARIYNVPIAQLLPESGDDVISFRDIARPNSMLQSLNKDERGLIAYYRALSKDNKKKLLEEMIRLSAEADEDGSAES